MTKKKKAALLISSLALIAVIVVGGTLAYFTSQDTRENIVTLGKVEGTLTETGENGRDDGTTGKDYPNVMPGDVLAKDPTITLDSESAPAYVRVQIDYINPATNQSDLTDAQIAELESALKLNAGWRKSGDYYYYNQTLDNDAERTTTTVFNEVTIPKTWGNEFAEKTFHMNVKAQLVQSDNFTVQRADDGSGDIIGWENVEFEQQR